MTGGRDLGLDGLGVERLHEAGLGREREIEGFGHGERDGSLTGRERVDGENVGSHTSSLNSIKGRSDLFREISAAILTLPVVSYVRDSGPSP